MRSARTAPLIVTVAAFVPGVAGAHLLVSGMGPLYDGVDHFGLTPQDVLPVAALGLLAGLRGPPTARLLLGVLPASWLVGGAIGMAGAVPAAPVLAWATAGLFMLVGGSLAADLRAPRAVFGLLSASLGLTRGLADLAGAAPDPGAALLSLAGMAASVFVAFALVASVTLPLTRLWMIVAARVAGSWLAAAGLLMAGWILRFGARVVS
jgi:urease accessory protein